MNNFPSLPPLHIPPPPVQPACPDRAASDSSSRKRSASDEASPQQNQGRQCTSSAMLTLQAMARGASPGPELAATAAQAHTMAPASPVSIRGRGMPQAADTAGLESTAFLEGALDSTTLAKMVVYLNREVSGDWAFTGSVALNIHAASLEGTMARPFQDADIQLDHKVFRSFVDQLDAKAGSHFTPPAKGSGDQHYRFGDMAIDFVEKKLRMNPALSESEMISGIRVLTLDALRLNKRNSACDFNTETVKKAQDDLLIIKRLLETKRLQQGPVAAESNARPRAAYDAPLTELARKALDF